MDATTNGGLDDLLDIEQVKARLNISERSVRTLVQLGHLPKVDLAPLRLVRFHPADVEAYIESRRSRPRPPRGKPTAATTPPERRGT